MYYVPSPSPHVSQGPHPDLPTPVFGPATSSPKEPLNTVNRTEGISPLPLKLEVTPTANSPALGNRTEVLGIEKGRGSSARRRWQKSQVFLIKEGEGSRLD